MDEIFIKKTSRPECLILNHQRDLRKWIESILRVYIKYLILVDTEARALRLSPAGGVSAGTVTSPARGTSSWPTSMSEEPVFRGASSNTPCTVSLGGTRLSTPCTSSRSWWTISSTLTGAVFVYGAGVMEGT